MLRLLAIIALCAVTYWPTLTIPLIEDDYSNIAQSLTYGTARGQFQLWSDPVFRLRATSYWLMKATWDAAHLRPEAYHAVSLALHAAAALLLFHLVSLWPPMRAGATGAAAFFGVYEGHQEAVMWFSAINELLAFSFGIGALICWVKAGTNPRWHVPGVALFALALISKESAVIFLPLLPLVRYRRSWALAPYLGLTLVALASVMASWPHSFRFQDGSFSFGAPFWITLPRSLARLHWIWGGCAAIFLAWRRHPGRPMLLAFVWMVLALAPYCFLTYSTAVPSRQTYLASAGLAMLVGLGLSCLRAARFDRRVNCLIVLAIIVQNAGTIWTRKHRQFLERAASTEQLIVAARQPGGAIRLRCSPLRSILVAQEAIRLAAPEAWDRVEWDDIGRCP